MVRPGAGGTTDDFVEEKLGGAAVETTRKVTVPPAECSRKSTLYVQRTAVAQVEETRKSLDTHSMEWTMLHEIRARTRPYLM